MAHVCGGGKGGGRHHRNHISPSRQAPTADVRNLDQSTPLQSLVGAATRTHEMFISKARALLLWGSSLAALRATMRPSTSRRPGPARPSRLANAVVKAKRARDSVPALVDLCEKGVRLAQKTRVGPCIPVGTQLQKAAVGPTYGPTWRLSHSGTRNPQGWANIWSNLRASDKGFAVKIWASLRNLDQLCEFLV